MFVHECVGVALCVYLDGWRGARRTTSVRSYPCIYDVRNGEFKVSLVKENVWKAIADTLRRTIYAWHCASFFASVVGMAEAVANSVFFSLDPRPI